MHTEDDVKALAKLLLVEVRKSPDAWVNCEALARVALKFCEERNNPWKPVAQFLKRAGAPVIKKEPK